MLKQYTQVEVCRSQNTQSWLGALYIYKGLLLIVGVYMAWETRNVKIPALNDSQYIGVSVYSVVITSAIIVVLANFLAEKVTLAFVTITALILASTTATLSLLFLPKINDIWGKGEKTKVSCLDYIPAQYIMLQRLTIYLGLRILIVYYQHNRDPK